MKNLLFKEFHLSASILSYLFILFALMTFLPGYPILVGAFFVSFGIFHSFQSGRENNDITFSVLLPVAKADVVKSKFAFCIFIEMCGFALMAAITVLRMAFLSDAAAYLSNELMAANFVFLGFALVIFGLFNLIFIRGFFKTAYSYGKPFVMFIVVAFVIVGLAEALHHIPGMEITNTLTFEKMGLQLSALCCGTVLYAVMTVTAIKSSIKRFERIDL